MPLELPVVKGYEVVTLRMRKDSFPVQRRVATRQDEVLRPNAARKECSL